MSLSRDTAYNLAGTALPVLVALATIPAYIRVIGEGRYGILAIVWLLLGYFGLFDLGIGRAAAQRISARPAGAQGGARGGDHATTCWTAVALNLALGIAGGAVLYPVASYYFGRQFDVDPALAAEIAGALPWMMLALPLATLTGALNGALLGVGRFLVMNTVNSTSSMLFQSVPLGVAIVWSPELGTVLPAAILSRAAGVVALFVVCTRHFRRVGAYPTSATSPTSAPFPVSRAESRALLRFGGWVSVSSVISPIMVTADRFVVGGVLGPAALAFYSVSFQLAERTTILAGALSSSAFPRFAKADAAERRGLAERTTRVLVYVTTPLIALGVVFAAPLLSLWITPEFARSAAPALQVFLFGFWANGLARIPHALLQASGRPKSVAVSHAVELVPFVLILIVSVRAFGLVGGAAAFTARVVFDLLLLSWFAGTFSGTLRTLVVGSLAMGAAGFVGAALR